MTEFLLRREEIRLVVLFETDSERKAVNFSHEFLYQHLILYVAAKYQPQLVWIKSAAENQ